MIKNTHAVTGLALPLLARTLKTSETTDSITIIRNIPKIMIPMALV
jgi:hypothetical protein